MPATEPLWPRHPMCEATDMAPAERDEDGTVVVDERADRCQQRDDLEWVDTPRAVGWFCEQHASKALRRKATRR